MTQVNMLEAKTNLSKLVEAVESGKEAEIVIARNGKPVARITPIAQPVVDTSKRLGIAAGRFGPFDEAWVKEFEAAGKEIAKQFYSEPLYATYPQAKRAHARAKSKSRA